MRQRGLKVRSYYYSLEPLSRAHLKYKNWEPTLTSFSNLTAWQSRGSKGSHAVNAIEGLGWKFDHSNPNKEEQIKSWQATGKVIIEKTRGGKFLWNRN